MRSFRFAIAGLGYLARTQPNFRVHLVVAVAVAVTAVALNAGPLDVAVLLLAIGLVLVAEALNTAVEAVVDLVTPDYHPLARIAKDAAAAGVLAAAVVAALIGLIVLGPRLFARLFG
jgi:diacylglycerol kinase